MAHGIDIHQDKGNPDWQHVAAAGFRFAWLKVSEGVGYPPSNDWYERNKRAAAAAGVAVGGYHFARPDTAASSAIEEADFFLSRLHLERGDLLPVLDFEHEPPDAGWALAWLAHVEAKIGARPVLYTYPKFLARTARHDELARYPLWYASYGTNDGRRHSLTVPAGFTLVAHQFTSNGRVPSIPGAVDLDYAHNLDALIYRKPRPARDRWVLRQHGDRVARTRPVRPGGGRMKDMLRRFLRRVRPLIRKKGGGRIVKRDVK